MKINTKKVKLLSDQLTPVSAFLKIRDITDSPCLLESNDYQSYQNSRSIVGFDPLIEIFPKNDRLIVKTLGREESVAPGKLTNIPDLVNQIRQKISISGEETEVNGFFGHTNFEAIRYFDEVDLNGQTEEMDIPEFHYFFYRFLVVFDHYRDQMTLIENIPAGESSDLKKIKKLLLMGHYEEKKFDLVGDRECNMSDDEFLELVSRGKKHCENGDVLQIVLSRRYQQEFSGDDFSVYRVLRSVNPSPYLYYFDFGSYRIFGSSPESQLNASDGYARVNPIAGTYRRTGNDEEDIRQARALTQDPKEVAEHTMLVDLAREDLGKSCHEIKVKSLMEIQYFSHVIHLVSTVEGKLPEKFNPFRVFGDTFPAGTLSGAPKLKAIELIHQYESTVRGPYGGAIGYFGLDGSITQAIVIRSFLSKDSVLYSQAGAGIVVSSQETKELEEVKNKLAALNMALDRAVEIFQ